MWLTIGIQMLRRFRKTTGIATKTHELGCGADIKAPRYPFEVFLLMFFAFTLPMFEGAKNILWAAYCITWLINRHRSGELSATRWDRWDAIIVGWVLTGYLSAVFAGLPGRALQGANDLLRYGAILFLIKRSGYGQTEAQLVFVALLAGVVPTAVWGFVRAYILKTKVFLELNSVGHVNHSSVYLAIIAGSSLAVAQATWHFLRKQLRWALSCGLILTTAALALTSSRAAIGAFVVFLVAIAFFWRSRVILLFLLAAVALGIAAEFVPGTYGIVTKLKGGIQSNNLSSHRTDIWRMGMQAVRQFPLFGVGMDNYSKITVNRVCEWHEQRQETCPRESYKHSFAPHAHGLAVNTLAERGLVGFAGLLIALGAWALLLWRTRKRTQPPDRALWGASFAALTITFFGGLLNTTMHHEIAILPVMVLGFHIALQWVKEDDGQATPPAETTATRAA
jgi:O-antigen ligase